MKKILYFICLVFVITGCSCNHDDKKVSYYINGVSYVQKDDGNLAIFSITNNSKVDGKIGYLSYNIYDDNENIVEHQVYKYDKEFLANHRYLVSVKINKIKFNYIELKPLYDDKSEIKYSDKQPIEEFSEMSDYDYNINNDKVKITIIPEKDFHVNEFQLIGYNAINREIIVTYSKDSVDLKENIEYEIEFDKLDQPIGTITSVKLFYR